MKKLLAVMISLVLVAVSILTAYAFDPLPFDGQVEYCFLKYYNQQTGTKELADFRAVDISDDIPESVFPNYYCLVQFTSVDAEETKVFHTFGDDNMFYERNDVTNQVYPSGIAVSIGDPYNYGPKLPEWPPYTGREQEIWEKYLKDPSSIDDENEKIDLFYSLSQVAEFNPAAIDYISSVIGKEYVGRTFDVNGDNNVNIDDASKMQRGLAHLLTFEAWQTDVADIDGNGTFNVNDVTALQKFLAK